MQLFLIKGAFTVKLLLIVVAFGVRRVCPRAGTAATPSQWPLRMPGRACVACALTSPRCLTAQYPHPWGARGTSSRASVPCTPVPGQPLLLGVRLDWFSGTSSTWNRTAWILFVSNVTQHNY